MANNFGKCDRCKYIFSYIDEPKCPKCFTMVIKKADRDIDIFVESFNDIAKSVHENALNKGWWDEPREDGTIIALIISEACEALEALRHGNPPDDKVPAYDGASAELADVIIRIMDYAQGRNFKVAEALVTKIAFNKTREYKHGGKKF